MEHRNRTVLGDKSLNLLSSEEIHTVLTKCIALLVRLKAQATAAGSLGLVYEERKTYTDYMVVTLFILLLGPRQQNFRSMATDTLQPPRSQHNLSDEYEIHIMGDALKNQKPALHVIPTELTELFRFYLEYILNSDYSGPLFLLRSGKPRVDFGPVVREVISCLLGRMIGPHEVRKSLDTHWGRLSDITPNDRRQLAEIQGHSISVQEEFYIAKERRPAQRKFQQRLLNGCGPKEE
jgi:hypothetical protein